MRATPNLFEGVMRRRNALVIALVTALLATQGCHRAPIAASVALEECDPAGFSPCIQQAALLSIPVTDTGLALTYSSARVWDATPLGLGGWSLGPIHRYDSASRVLMSGDGTWRLTESVSLASGGRAVPSFDGAVAYIFNSAGQHVQTVDGHLGSALVTITYDTAGRLSAIDGSVDAQPVHVSVQRSADGKPLALVGADGVTSLGVDDAGHLSSITDPAGKTTHLDWNAAGLVTAKTDPMGAVERYTYDASGLLATATDADGVARKFERSTLPSGIEIRVTTTLGRHWAYRGESSNGGLHRTFIAADGSTRSETMDAHGARNILLADGTKISVGASQNAAWGAAAPILTPIVETRPDGVTSRREVKQALHSERGLPYLLAGSETITVNGQAWVQQFEPNRHSISLVDPAGRRMARIFDDGGRLLSRSAPGTAPLSYAYNAQGRKTSKTVGTGVLAQTTRYDYEAASGQLTTTRPDGTEVKTQFNRLGAPVKFTAGDGATVVMTYNAAGRLTQLQPPGGVSFTLGTSAAGRPTAFVPPMEEDDSSAETTSYDADGKLVAITGLGKRSIDISYDSAGRIASWSFNQGKASVAYDGDSGLVTQIADPSGVITSYRYAGRLPTELAWSGPITGSVSAKLNANGRAATEAVNGASSLDFNYDASGKLTGIGPLSLKRDAESGLVTHATLGAIDTMQEFDANARLIRSTTTARGVTVLDQRYTRDELGRIKTVAETQKGGKTSTTEYSYDRAGRLASVRLDGQVVETNSYDPAGNRISVVRGAETLTATYDDRERELTCGSTRFTWAPDGSLTRRSDGNSATSFAYDDFGALRAAVLPDGRSIKYLVDAQRRRVGREAAGKLTRGYLYRSDGSIAAEVDAGGKVLSRFGYDDRRHLALVIRDGVTYRVITDAIGSPRIILDSRDGTVAEAITYDAWGYVTQDTAPGFTPFGFAGGLRDVDTGLVRFGARDYDPKTGRWTAADPLRFGGGDANLYRYAAGDPVNRVDRNGLSDDDSESQADYEYEQKYGNGEDPTVAAQAMADALGETVDGVEPSYGEYHAPDPDDKEGDDSTLGSFPAWAPWSKGRAGNSPNDAACKICSTGDPHVSTDQRVHLDFQAAGEFSIAASQDGQFVIQARQEPYPGRTDVTFDTAVAANVAGDRVGVYANEPAFLMVNGAALPQADLAERLPHGGAVERHGGVVTVDWPDGSRLVVTRIGITLGFSVVARPNGVAALDGLLAQAHTGASDTLTGRDARALALSDPDFHAKLYAQFGNSWRISQSESLFFYWPGESTAKFTNLAIPSRPVSAASISSEARAKAEAICRAVGISTQPQLDDCILDVGVTGVPAFATASLMFSESAPPPQAASASSGARAAPSAAPALVEQYSIKIGDTVSSGHPSSEAGTISKLGEKQSYAFPSQAGQIVYLSVGPCEGATPRFEVRGPDDIPVTGNLGCTDLGRVVLPRTGTYNIVVQAGGASARYSFVLRPLPPDRHFSGHLPLSVSPDHPDAGAGLISHLGEQQFYTFPAEAGQTVYLSVGPCEGATPLFELRAPDDARVTANLGCSDLGRVVLPKAGTYSIVVRAGGPAARFSFALRTIAPK